MGQPSGPPFVADAVCFDLLTALLDSWALWEEVAAAAGRPGQGQPWRHEALRRVATAGGYRPYRDLVAAAADEAELAPEIADVLLARWGELRPWPEVPVVLARLDQLLATATNCPEALARAGVAALGNPFAVVVSAERAGAYKPDPRPYQLALDELGLSAERVLFVAGSSHDVVGAIRMGMPVVWVNRLGLPVPPGAESATIVPDLTRLPHLVARGGGAEPGGEREETTAASNPVSNGRMRRRPCAIR